MNSNTYLQGDSKNSGSTTQTESLQSLRNSFSSSGSPSRKNPSLPDHTETGRTLPQVCDADGGANKLSFVP